MNTRNYERQMILKFNLGNRLLLMNIQKIISYFKKWPIEYIRTYYEVDPYFTNIMLNRRPNIYTANQYSSTKQYMYKKL